MINESKNVLIQLPQAGFKFDLQRFEGAEFPETLYKDGDVYLIKTTEDLNALATYVNGGGDCSGKTFRLDADITFNNEEGNYTPIGINATNYFKGTFNGADHTISGINCSVDAQYVGLFGYTQNVTIENVKLDNCIFKSTFKNSSSDSSKLLSIGSIVGYFDSTKNITIHNCQVTNGNISYTAVADNDKVATRIGGIVGYTSDFTTTQNCSFAGEINDSINNNPTIDEHFVGGIVGCANGTVTDCVAQATVSCTSTKSNVGGIIGRNYAIINNNLFVGGGDNTLSGGKVGAIIGEGVNGTDNDYKVTGNYYYNAGTGIYGVNGRDINNGTAPAYKITMPEGVEVTGAKYNSGNDYYFASGAEITINGLKETDKITLPKGYSYSYEATDGGATIILTEEGTAKGTITVTMAEDLTFNAVENIDFIAMLETTKKIVNDQEVTVYLIKTAEDMKALAAYVNASNNCYEKTFKLANDLDFSGKTYTPIGNGKFDETTRTYRSFSGTFDGGNHTISNITCSSSAEYVGLFGFTEGATIENVNLKDCNFTSTYTGEGDINLGSIVGNNGGEISNCHVTGGKISASGNCDGTHIGGIAGQNYDDGSIENSSYEGSVSDSSTVSGDASYHYVGGIVGLNDSGEVTESVAQASVKCESEYKNKKYVGGIAGFNNEGTISKNLFVGVGGTLSGGTGTTGAIAGKDASGSYDSNYYHNAGTGIKGIGTKETEDTAQTAPVDAIYTIKLVDNDNANATFEGVKVTGAYSAGNNKYICINGNVTVSGLGENQKVILPNLPKGYSYTTADTTVNITKSGSAEPVATFTVQTGADSYSINNIVYNNFPENLDKDGDVYLIETAEDMQALANYINDGNGSKCANYEFRLEKDIDFEGKDYTPIGSELGFNSSFKAKFNGNGHTISNIKYETPAQYVGLFGSIWEATISDLKLENCTFTSTSSNTVYLGSIVGFAFGASTISNCQVTGGNVSCSENCNATNIGGISGSIGNGYITDCLFEGSVSDLGTANNHRVGGIVGANASTVTGSVAQASVSSKNGGYVGGIAGYNDVYGTLSNNAFVGKDGGLSSDTNDIGTIAGNNSYLHTTIQGNYYYNSKIQKDIGNSSSDTKEGYKIIVPEGVTVTGAFALGNNEYVCTENVTISNLGEDQKIKLPNGYNFTYSEDESPTATVHVAWGSNNYTININMAEGENFIKADNILDSTNFPENLVKDGDFYLIQTAADLATLAKYVNGTDGYSAHDCNDKKFRLTDDIAFDGTEGNYTPIGTGYSRSFKGEFDGAGHTISGINCNYGSNDVGLFGYIGMYGQVHDVNLKGCYFKSNTGGNGQEINIGSIAGYNLGTIKNCHVTDGNISYAKDKSCWITEIGGIAGFSSQFIENCSFEGTVSDLSTVTNRHYVGGIAGKNGGTITNSMAQASVSCDPTTDDKPEYVGGIAGWSQSNMSNNFFIGDGETPISGGDKYIGAIAGDNDSNDRTSNNYYYNSKGVKGVNGKDIIGGAAPAYIITVPEDTEVEGALDIGSNQYACPANVQITNLQNNGIIKLPNLPTGYKYNYTADGAETATVTVTPKDNTTNVKATFKITMASDATFQQSKNILDNDDFPKNLDIVIEGEESKNVYLIKTVEDMQTLARYVNGGQKYEGVTFRLANNIDFTDETYTPIGTKENYFQGIFDGNGKIISGINCSVAENYVGLFGVNNGTIQNVNLEKCSFTSIVEENNAYIGSIVGENGASGTIINCHVTDTTVTASNENGDYTEIGGIAGINYRGIINDCSFDGTVYDESNVNLKHRVGGIVGQNNGEVTCCVANADVKCNSSKIEIDSSNPSSDSIPQFVGGIAGYNDAGLLSENFFIGKTDNESLINRTSSDIGAISGGNDNNPTVIKNYYYNTGAIKGVGDEGGKDDDGAKPAYQFTLPKDAKVEGAFEISSDSQSVTYACSANVEISNLASSYVFDFPQGSSYSCKVSDEGQNATVTFKQNNTEQITFTISMAEDSTFSESVNINFLDMLETDGTGAYLIQTADDIEALAAYVNAGNHCKDLTFKLAGDIDFKGGNHTPIGTGSNNFRGTFDGDGHTISNITCNSAERFVGLFGYASGGTIHDVNLKGCTFESTFENSTQDATVGSIVALHVVGKIENCHVTNGNVSYNKECKTTHIGGIVGQNNSGHITNCSFEGEVSDSMYTENPLSGHNVGGIVADNGGEVTDCVAQATVKCTTSDLRKKYVGGIVGYNYNGKIEDNVFVGGGISVSNNSSSSNRIGVIAGYNNCKDFSNNYYYNIEGIDGIGLAENDGANIEGATINVAAGDSYTIILPADVTVTGAVKGEEVGDNQIEYTCPKNGKVVIIDFTEEGQIKFQQEGYSYALGESDTTVTLKQNNETIGTIQVVPESDATFDVGKNIDFLSMLAKDDDVYLIQNVEDMQAFAAYVNSGHDCLGLTFKLAGDIDFKGGNHTPIGTEGNPFKGTFEGDDYIISNITCTSDAKYVGLFGYTSFTVDANTTYRATIQNVNLENCSFTSNFNDENKQKDAYVGSIVAYNSGTIRNCHVTGATTTVSYSEGKECNMTRIGGIVGLNSSGITENCLFEGSVSDSGNADLHLVGGIAGQNSGGKVTACVANASVSSKNGGYVGGIAGQNFDELSNNLFVGNNDNAISGGSTYYHDRTGAIAGDNTNNAITSNYYYNSNINEGIGYTGSGKEGTAPAFTINLPEEVEVEGAVKLESGEYVCSAKVKISNFPGNGQIIFPQGYSYSYSNPENVPTVELYEGQTDNSGNITYTSKAKFEIEMAEDAEFSAGNNIDLFSMIETTTEKLEDGNTQTVYLIKTANELQMLANYVNAGNDCVDKTFRLAKDITFDGTENNYTPIGTGSNKFRGTFDGDGYTISGINCTSSDNPDTQYIGLFGYVENAKILNVNLNDCDFISNESRGSVLVYIGSIVGFNSDGEINNCHVTDATVSHAGDNVLLRVVGGIVGKNVNNDEDSNGKIENCSFDGEVSDSGNKANNHEVGGIVGQNQLTPITGCVANASVSSSGDGESNVGGIVGYIAGYAKFTNNLFVGKDGETPISGGSGTNHIGAIAGFDADNRGEFENNYYYNAGQFNSENIAGVNGADVDGTTTIGTAPAYTITLPADVEVEGAVKLESGEYVCSAEVKISNFPAGNEKISINQSGYSYSFNAATSTVTLKKVETVNDQIVSTPVGTFEIEMSDGSAFNAGKYIDLLSMLNEQDNDVYLIKTADDMRALAAYANAGNNCWWKTFKLDNDIEFEKCAEDESNYTPIGKDGAFFGGTFDGNGYTISGINCISGEKYVGLFGYSEYGNIKNVKLEDSTFTSTSTNTVYVGSIVGENGASGTIINCHVTDATVEYEKSCNNMYIGGIAGQNTSKIENCSFDGGVIDSGEAYVHHIGGIVGDNYGEVTDCVSQASVSSENGGDVGGIAGYNNGESAKIKNNLFVGGKLSNGSYTTGAIAGNNSGGTFENNYYYNTNGIKGVNGNTDIENKDEHGNITTIGTAPAVCIFKLVDTENENETFDSVTFTPAGKTILISDNQYVCSGNVTVKGLTSTQKVVFSNLPTGYSYISDSGNVMLKYTSTNDQNEPVETTIATISVEGSGSLVYQFPANLDKDGDVYLIKTAEDMQALATYVNADYSNHCSGLKFRLANDIDFKDKEYTPIGVSSRSFKGEFDGDIYTIKNITCNSNAQYVGLFGTTENATIKHVKLENCSFISKFNDQGSFTWIGGISGKNNSGIISDCHVTGATTTVGYAEEGNSRFAFIGGIVGDNSSSSNTDQYPNSTIQYCSFEGTVSGSSSCRQMVGGIVGQNYTNSIVENCVANASVNAKDGGVGGIAGYNYEGTLSNNLFVGKETNSLNNGTYIGVSVGAIVGDNSSDKLTSNYYYNSGNFNGVGSHGSRTGKEDIAGKTEKTYTITLPAGVEVEGAVNIGGTQYACSANVKITNFPADGQITIPKGYSYSVSGSTITLKDSDGNTKGTFEIEMADGAEFNVGKIIDILAMFEVDTEDGAYLIKTVEDMKALADYVNADESHDCGGKKFKLANDIEFDGTEGNYTPIGNGKYNEETRFNISFCGTFDGNGYTISGINCNSNEDYIGLFGFAGATKIEETIYTATIQNINLENCTFTSSSTGGIVIGSIAGYNYAGTISDCHITGATVVGYEGSCEGVLIGGLAGVNYGGIIKYCSIDGNINDSSNFSNDVPHQVGGIVGDNYSLVENCVANVSVTCISTDGKNQCVGGIVGYNESEFDGGTIENNLFVGKGNKITCTGSGEQCVGAIVGWNGGTVESNYYDKVIESTKGIGNNTGDEDPTQTKLTETYTITLPAGAIVKGAGKLENNQYVCAKEFDNTIEVKNFAADGQIKFPSGCSYSYTTDAETNVTTVELTQGNETKGTFEIEMAEDAEADFDPGKNIDFLSMLAKDEDVYLIQNEDDMNALAAYVNADPSHNCAGLKFRLANNIVFTDLGADKSNYIPIGTSSNKFCGEFDGNGYTISGINCISGKEHVGLFGYIDMKGIIKDVNLDNCKFISIVDNSNLYVYVGSIVGENSGGTISDCRVTNATVKYETGKSCKGSQIGGIAGQNYSNITNCSFVGDVIDLSYANGEHKVGGIVGKNNKEVTGCVAQASVSSTGSSDVGGIAGYNISTLNNNLFVGKGATPLSGRTASTGAIAGDNTNNAITSNYYYNAGTGITGIGNTQDDIAKTAPAYKIILPASVEVTTGAVKFSEIKPEDVVTAYEYVCSPIKEVTAKNFASGSEITVPAGCEYTFASSKLTLKDVNNKTVTINLKDASNEVLSNESIIIFNTTGTVTVNTTTYNSTGALVISAVNETNSSSLVNGVVTVCESKSLNTANSNYTLAVTSGEVTAEVEDGKLTKVTGTGETNYAYNNKSLQTAAAFTANYDNDVLASIETSGSVTYVGKPLAITGENIVTATYDSSGNLVTVSGIKADETIVYNSGEELKVTAGEVTATYNTSNGELVSVNYLNDGDKFEITSGNVTEQYEVLANGIVRTSTSDNTEYHEPEGSGSLNLADANWTTAKMLDSSRRIILAKNTVYIDSTAKVIASVDANGSLTSGDTSSKNYTVVIDSADAGTYTIPDTFKKFSKNNYTVTANGSYDVTKSTINVTNVTEITVSNSLSIAFEENTATKTESGNVWTKDITTDKTAFAFEQFKPTAELESEGNNQWQLYNGEFEFTQSLTTSGNDTLTLTSTNNDAKVKATVANGRLTKITGINAGETVKVNDALLSVTGVTGGTVTAEFQDGNLVSVSGLSAGTFVTYNDITYKYKINLPQGITATCDNTTDRVKVDGVYYYSEGAKITLSRDLADGEQITFESPIDSRITQLDSSGNNVIAKVGETPVLTLSGLTFSDSVQCTWSVSASGTSASYGTECTQAGARISGTKIVYQPKGYTADFTLNNLASGTTYAQVNAYIQVKDDTITFNSPSILDPTKTITAPEGYVLKLGEGFTADTTPAKWTQHKDTNTAYIYTVEGIIGGYTDVGNKIYYNEVALPTISFYGLANNLATEDFSLPEGIEITKQEDNSYKIKYTNEEVLDGNIPTVVANKGITYTLEVAEDMKPVQKNPAWRANKLNYAVSADITAGYTVENNRLVYNEVVKGEPLFEISGSIQIEDLIKPLDDKVLTINADALGSTSFIKGNNHNYQVKLTGDMTGKTFSGSTLLDEDLIIEANNALINTYNGNDTIEVKGNNVTVIAGAGNDIIYLSNDAQNTSIVFDKDSGNITVYGYKPGSTKLKVTTSLNDYSQEAYDDDILIKVGKATLTLKDANDIFQDTDVNQVVDPNAFPPGINASFSSLTANTEYAEGTLSLEDYPMTFTNISAGTVTKNIKLVGNAVGNVISGGSGNDTIDGGDGNDSLFGGAGNDVLNGNNGNDTLNGGAGNDIFVYESGNDVIYDYKPGEDIIRLNVEDIDAAIAHLNSTVTGNIELTIEDKGTLVILGGNSSQIITFVDNNEQQTQKIFFEGISYDPLDSGLSYNSDRTMLIASNDFYGSEIKDTDYLDRVKYVNASSVGRNLTIDGNANDNSIYGGSADDMISGGDGNDSLFGGSGKDTLNGEAGNNTLTGGNGSDVFVYNGEGNDVITDYKSGEDKIKFDVDEMESSACEGNNVVITTKAGKTLTINSAKESLITFVDDDGAVTKQFYFSGNEHYAPLAKGLTYKSSNTILDVSTVFSGSRIDLGECASTVKNVKAGSLTKRVEIIGNSNNNSIKSGSGSDTLDGNAGNDTILGGTGADSIYGNAGNDVLKGDAGNDTLSGGAGDDTLTGGAGTDVFVYESGNDVITDYTAGESIKIKDTTITNTIYEETNVKFETANGGTLTVQNGKGKKITIIDKDGQTNTQTYSGTQLYQSYSRTIDLIYDCNFMEEEYSSLDEITEQKYSVTEIQDSDNEKDITKDQKILTYGEDK